VAPTVEDIEALIPSVCFDDKGLVPVVAQDAQTGVVRMMAWANEEALRATGESGFATFFSRSRGKLWCKGESSGNTLAVQTIRLDCDGDLILLTVDANGPSCHTGATSCLYREARGGELRADDGPPAPPAATAPATVIDRVAEVIAARRGQDPKSSYVASLLSKGFPKINAKITEEAGELCEALPEGDKAHTVYEAADLIFHALVGLEAADAKVSDVYAELERRFGVSGHTEKAGRSK